MSRRYAYEPPEKPVVGGHSATFPEWARKAGRNTAIAATQRVLAKESYEPTGDEAFDIRARAFRDALIAGRQEMFEESYPAFLSVGLYST